MKKKLWQQIHADLQLTQVRQLELKKVDFERKNAKRDKSLHYTVFSKIFWKLF